MGKVIIATGIPGSGKTTVLDTARERTKAKFSVVTFGTVMFEIASEKKLVTHRDELRKLPQETQRKIQEHAAKRIASMSEKETIVVDTHCTIKTPAGYLPGLPKTVISALEPDVIVLVESSPEEIARRRNSDETRKRDEESTEDIALQQELNRAYAMACSMRTGATVKIIYNYDNHLDAASREMAKTIEA